VSRPYAGGRGEEIDLHGHSLYKKDTYVHAG
jgi:hypothetical protein